MYHRIKQFFSAIGAQISKEDLAFIELYLNEEEKKLFKELDLPTQKHSINVARTALIIAEKNLPPPETEKIDKELLVKASLLHDLGKPAGGLKTWHRVCIVLLQRFLGKERLDKLTLDKYQYEGNSLKRALYLQKNHPVLGGKLARKKNFEPSLIFMIENHHAKLTEACSSELSILQQADNLN